MKFYLIDHYKIRKSARSVIFVGREMSDEVRTSKHYFLVDDFHPYMGVPTKEANNMKIEDNYSVVRTEVSNDIYGNEITKVIVKREDDVNVLRDMFSQTYETNVLFHNRVKIDLGIKSGFEIPDSKIKNGCFGCNQNMNKYHRVSYQDIGGF